MSSGVRMSTAVSGGDSGGDGTEGGKGGGEESAHALERETSTVKKAELMDKALALRVLLSLGLANVAPTALGGLARSYRTALPVACMGGC